MRKRSRLCVVLLATTCLAAIGCDGGKYSAVSGIVTVDGQPIANVRVVFAPEAVGDNHSPGPWSKGVSDESGRFTLRTRHGDPGAVVGPHKVGFEWNDIDFDELSTLRQEVKSSKNPEAVKTKIAELKQKIKSRPKINETVSLDFEVPQGGTTSADFEIAKTIK